MTWSYDDALPTDRDWVRMRIGDTDVNAKLLSDEAIDSFLAEQVTRTLAAAVAARTIGGTLARRAMSFSGGGTSVNWGPISDRFYALADKLVAEDEATDPSGLFDWAEQITPGDEFAARERFRDQVFRGAV